VSEQEGAKRLMALQLLTKRWDARHAMLFVFLRFFVKFCCSTVLARAQPCTVAEERRNISTARAEALPGLFDELSVASFRRAALEGAGADPAVQVSH
jgi:hypothetical protein